MKVIRHFPAFQNPDSGWELGVKSGDPVDRVHGELIRRVKVSDLAGGMDACVGASRSMDPQGLLGNFGKGTFQAPLDGVSIGLELPAAERASVVSNGQFKAHTQFFAKFSSIGKAALRAKEGSVIVAG